VIDYAYHFTPDLNAALLAAIPLICPAKKDVLSFFRSTGLRGPRLAEQEASLGRDSSSFRKHAATRVLLEAVNEDHSNDGLRVRREVIKRVTTFNNFGACWPDDQMPAKGAVQTVRDLVKEKDAVTRIIQAEERERHARVAESERNAEHLRKRAAERESVKRELFALFSVQDARRGILFEGVLNRFFALDGLTVREAFRLVGSAGEGVVEQIDGVVELDGHLYLVEAKWWSENLGTGDVAQHTVRVAGRSGMRGLYVVHPGYSNAAITMIRDALQRGVFVLAIVEELVALLDTNDSIADWLRAKVRHAMIDRDPFRPRRRGSVP